MCKQSSQRGRTIEGLQWTFPNHVKMMVRHFEWIAASEWRTPLRALRYTAVMVKNCCVVGCCNVYKKASGIHFYRFPTNAEKRSKWIAAVKREGWSPNQNTWICSVHFVTGEKSSNPLAPNFVPTIFPHLKSPAKRKLLNDAATFQRRQALKRRRLVAAQGQSSANSSAEVDVVVANEEDRKDDNERDQQGVGSDDRQNDGERDQQGVGSDDRENDGERDQQGVANDDRQNDSVATRPDNQSNELLVSEVGFALF